MIKIYELSADRLNYLSAGGKIVKSQINEPHCRMWHKRKGKHQPTSLRVKKLRWGNTSEMGQTPSSPPIADTHRHTQTSCKHSRWQSRRRQSEPVTLVPTNRRPNFYLPTVTASGSCWSPNTPSVTSPPRSLISSTKDHTNSLQQRLSDAFWVGFPDKVPANRCWDLIQEKQRNSFWGCREGRGEVHEIMFDERMKPLLIWWPNWYSVNENIKINPECRFLFSKAETEKTSDQKAVKNDQQSSDCVESVPQTWSSPLNTQEMFFSVPPQSNCAVCSLGLMSELSIRLDHQQRPLITQTVI